MMHFQRFLLVTLVTACTKRKVTQKTLIEIKLSPMQYQQKGRYKLFENANSIKNKFKMWKDKFV